jgi:NAD(P)-dependent dehydrogenase (short-subunit alcohol dehydrogenase family)
MINYLDRSVAGIAAPGMSHFFDGQVAIVTGAARGIGLGIALQLKADGARDARSDRAQHSLGQLGERLIGSRSRKTSKRSALSTLEARTLALTRLNGHLSF